MLPKGPLPVIIGRVLAGPSMWGPCSACEMGGMFTIVKVWDDLKSYEVTTAWRVE